MDWNMIGALGEAAGAIAVVVTLFYLARQIRDSARENRRLEYAQLNRDFLQLPNAIAHDESFANLFFRGAVDPSSLSPPETARLYSGVLLMFRTLEALFHYHGEGGIDDWGLDGYRATMVDMMSLPGVRQYWTERRHWFSAEFQSEVDRWLSQELEPMHVRLSREAAESERQSERAEVGKESPRTGE